jgi:cell division septation protein DedD
MRGEGNTLRHQECENMRTVRNITVAVTPELYRQTRMLAAEYDSTVTALVAYLLERLPKALKAARFPVGGPQAAAPAKPTQSASSTVATSAMPPPPRPKKMYFPSVRLQTPT